MENTEMTDVQQPNVLFVPEMYNDVEEAALMETQSISTVAGVESVTSNYQTGLDPSLFKA